MNPVHTRLIATRGMGGVRVVHVHSDEFGEAADCNKVYIGRTFGGWENTGWGNPFPISPVRNREQAIEQYRKWLLQNDKLLARIPELRGKLLGCWCSPEPCHGHVLAALAGLTDEELAVLRKVKVGK